MNLNVDHFKRLTPLSPLPAIVVGFALLFFGRKLFWLFVGAIGFVVGAEFAPALFPHKPEWALIGGLVLGLIAAVIAVFVQKVAIALGGFLAGGYFLMTLLGALELLAPQHSWISFLLGGVIGAMLMVFLFDWALIVFSSMSGAHLITHAVTLSSTLATAAFAVLFLVGIVTQARMRAPRSVGVL